MNTAQLTALIRGIAGPIKDAIQAATAELERRVKALEDRPPVAGKDGAPGARGEPGPAGRDGLGFDDLEMVYDGVRTFTFRMTKGARVVEKVFAMPVVIDRGVWVAGETYVPGDAVSYDGSLWIAQEETGRQPGTSKSWRLAVKHGRDGRNGKDGAPGPQGPQGRAGADLTHVGPGGEKW